MNGACTHFLAPHPGALGEGSKDQISLNFNYKVNFESAGICDGTNDQLRCLDTIRCCNLVSNMDL